MFITELQGTILALMSQICSTDTQLPPDQHGHNLQNGH